MKPKTEEEVKQEQLDDTALLWSKMLRRMALPATPKGKASTWKKMSPEACKIYILIWALTSTFPTTAVTGHKLAEGVTLKKLEALSGLSGYPFDTALKQLNKLKLIKIYTYGNDYHASIILNLTSEEMGIS